MFSTEADTQRSAEQSMVMSLFKAYGIVQVDLNRKGLRKNIPDGGKSTSNGLGI